jgi:hypothetical protein
MWYVSTIDPHLNVVFLHCIVKTTVARLIYASVLRANDQMYSPTGCSVPTHHYDVLELIIKTPGYYRISSNSSIGLRASIYQNTFDPVNPSLNLRAEKEGDLGFRLTLFLRAETIYMLVVTSVTPHQTGAFSIVSAGPANVTARRIGKFFCVLQ